MKNKTAFLSHSNHEEDQIYIDLLFSAFCGMGIDLYIAERPENAEGDKELSDKLNNHINSKDIFVVLYTFHAHKSQIVQQEIGRADNAKKQIIAIVEDGVSPLGRTEGREQFRCLDRSKDPKKVIREIVDRFKATLGIKKQNKGEARELNDSERKILELLVNADESEMPQKVLKKFLGVSVKEYNLATNKLMYDDLIEEGGSIGFYNGMTDSLTWRLTGSGHQVLRDL
ncbi:hypothetical protein A2291_02855 [candidate division WOR-1 bacterium RIFOXYB2_FULL_42_35]|uniref:Thoeris protein ThsB TIR-like domain-containing protein n=1 Tax=candidate division WOR-1 bacterium RIFOXYC2_FULL_41_25 TaxID=1802586 RepID=A0A1F4TQT6_UNCSA|nr:MAG: hypothetical protein A2247_01165 [candidate division WOR-1 bacterium RIFOXYA2_FULL_41_14]OGC25690.1 MAG: hypothetical protein A2291_02855 [candidate division WOR-1 bacterium RIFOXYB2_FULL_42_35]OGC35092.1 MAG: hypothetical protein A2462_06000 [candidate division WOR-1 bacterium RIFOXYC2_FULL_41_25]OGC43252.1 MAG: hypothetical protein A2548_04455 [candidate division WOR-1 bacterium RIFOXYD2_FULL_41_8]